VILETLRSHRNKISYKQKQNPFTDALKDTVRERLMPVFVKAVRFSQQSLLRSERQRLVMRQNNETMSARHAPHSTHCLKRLDSPNCLIKCVKTL